MAREPEIVFFHAPQSRALIVHWMLEELGEPYRMELVDLKNGHRESPRIWP